MFTALTYLLKTWLVAASALIIFIFGYNLSISPTFDLVGKIQEKKQKIEFAKNAPSEIIELKTKLNLLDKKVGRTSDNFELFQKEVLNAIVPFVDQKKIAINTIESPHLAQKNNYQVQTMRLKCEGNFKKLTELLDFIQQQNIGRICSVNYNLIKDIKSKKWRLFTTFYIQNYIDNNY